MRTVRVAAVVAAIAAAAVTVPATAKPAAPALRARNTITTRTSGYVDVVIPRDATLSPKVTGNPDVRISGGGRFVGFWLRRIDGAGTYDGLIAYRVPGFAGGATTVYGSTTPSATCTNFPNDTLPLRTECTDPDPTAILLRQGRYRLTVLADDAPVTFRLHLRGVGGGSRTVRPVRPLTSVQKALPALDSVGDKLVTYGATLPVRGPAEVFVIATATHSGAPVLRSRSVCLRRDTDTTPPLPYGPQCADGEAGSYVVELDAAGQERWIGGGFVTASSEEPTDDLGVGGSFGDGGGVKLGSALGVTLEVS